MTLHLIKLSVGTEDVADLEAFQKQRRRREGRVMHVTRMMPKRRAELLAGGSIYWVIRGAVRARQRLLDIEVLRDETGRTAAGLVLEPNLQRTQPHPHRPFQGWRYLPAKKAPADLSALPEGEAEMPEDMRAELRELGLL